MKVSTKTSREIIAANLNQAISFARRCFVALSLHFCRFAFRVSFWDVEPMRGRTWWEFGPDVSDLFYESREGTSNQAACRSDRTNHSQGITTAVSCEVMDRSDRSYGPFWASAAGSACFEHFCHAFFRWYCPLTVEGEQHLPDGPFLLCSNHASHADSAALMTASGRSFRDFALIGASDYFFHSRRLRWSVSPLMNVIPIERKPGAKTLSACLATCRKFLEQDRGILILYPEGTRSPDGQMQAFKAGAGLFAIELGVPVVPAHIEGTYRILPKGRSVPRTGPVKVRFGAPLEPPRWNFGNLPRDRRQHVIEDLTQSIRMLSPADEVADIQRKGIPSKTFGVR
jgi:1-acyl-sn-glycerol-3-phosphate acyltransferase